VRNAVLWRVDAAVEEGHKILLELDAFASRCALPFTCLLPRSFSRVRAADAPGLLGELSALQQTLAFGPPARVPCLPATRVACGAGTCCRQHMRVHALRRVLF
jgi:hypothetical protein